MKNFAVAKRYSTALWDSAKDASTAEAWLKSLQAVIAMTVESGDLRKFLSSPLFSADKKWAVMSELLQKIEAADFVKSFMEKFMRAGRMEALDDVVESYRQKVLSAQGVIELTVESALPLSDAQKQDLISRFEKITSKKIIIIGKAAPQLLAGMRVSYGGKTYDGSLRTHLDNLEKHLLKEDSEIHATA